MKPEIVTIAMRSPAPIEYSNDPRRPRPSSILESARRAMQVWTTRPNAVVRFTYPEPRRTLRELEERQVQVEASMRLETSMSFEHQRVMDELANRREARRKPRLSELHQRLRAKMT